MLKKFAHAIIFSPKGELVVNVINVDGIPSDTLRLTFMTRSPDISLDFVVNDTSNVIFCFK